MLELLWLVPLGVVVGAFGTLIGAGGGFVLVPILLLLYPHMPPDVITSISMAVVFVNAISGSLAYARKGRIDLPSGLILAAATIPGSILGSLTTSYIPRREFNIVFGVLILALAVFLLVKRPREGGETVAKTGRWCMQRCVVERCGTTHRYAYDTRIAVGSSLVIGYLSSLLGIGGGIIHVPVLANVLLFPPHIATATSQFALMVMSLVSTVVHIIDGSFLTGIRLTIPLAIGVLVGAQLGARISDHLKGVWLLRILAVALVFVGVRILIMSF